MLATLLLAAGMVQWLAIGFIAVAALAVAGASAVYFLRARSFEKALGADSAAVPVSSDGLAEMREIGQRIETLVSQQSMQGETQRQQLAQQIDTVGQRVDEQGNHVDGLKNELRHEVRRRDAEMEEIRNQLMSIQTGGLALGAGTSLQLPAADEHSMPIPAREASPADAAAQLTADALEGPGFEEDLVDVFNEAPSHLPDAIEAAVAATDFGTSATGETDLEAQGTDDSWDMEEAAWDLGGAPESDSFEDPFQQPLDESALPIGSHDATVDGVGATLPGSYGMPVWDDDEAMGDSGDSSDESLLRDIFASVAFDPAAPNPSGSHGPSPPSGDRPDSDDSSNAPQLHPVTAPSPFVFENAASEQPVASHSVMDDAAFLSVSPAFEASELDFAADSEPDGDSVAGDFDLPADAFALAPVDFGLAAEPAAPAPPADSAWVSVNGRADAPSEPSIEDAFDASSFAVPVFATADFDLPTSEPTGAIGTPIFDFEDDPDVPEVAGDWEAADVFDGLDSLETEAAFAAAAPSSAFPTFEQEVAPATDDFPTFESNVIDFPTFEADAVFNAEPDSSAFPTFGVAPTDEGLYPSFEAEEQLVSLDDSETSATFAVPAHDSGYAQEPEAAAQQYEAAPHDEPAPEETPVPAEAPATSAPVAVQAEPAADAPPPFVAPEGAEDLTVISTIDEHVQRLLYLAGVTTLDEIARWGRGDARRISAEVEVAEDTIVNQWIFEAQTVLFDRFSGSV